MGEADERADALIKTEEVDVEGTKLDRECQAALKMDLCWRKRSWTEHVNCAFSPV